MTDSFSSLAQLLAQLVHLLADLIYFGGRAVEELVDFVDDVTANSLFEGDGLDFVERGTRSIGTFHDDYPIAPPFVLKEIGLK